MSQSAGTSTLGPAFFNAAPSATTGGAIAGDHQNWSAWFGLPATEKEPHPYSLTNRSTWTLPMAYYGKSDFFGNTFTLLALASNSFLTTVILPLKATNSLQAHWGRYEFPAYLPDVVPDLGVTRHVKMNFIEQSASLVRYGIGMQMQHGFMTTEIGRACYVMHLRQINQAMMEGLQFECLYALANSGNWAVKESTKTDSWNAASAQAALYSTIAREKRAWAITQLHQDGHIQMDSFIEETNQPYNNEGLNTYIMDARIHSYLNTIAADQITASIYGEGVREKLKYGLQFEYTDIRGNKIYCTKRLLVEDQPINPLERQAEIGEFVVSYDSERSIVNYTFYESGDRDISIYSQDHDAWKQVSLQEMHDNSFRFDENTGRLRQFSNRYSSTEGRDKDHLFHKINGDLVPLSFFGQMKKEHFTSHDYECLATTVVSQVGRGHRKTASKINESLAKIGNILNIMHRTPLNDGFNLWLRVLSAENPGRHINNADNALAYAPLAEVQSNAYNSLSIPVGGQDKYTAAAFKAIKKDIPLPPTHGTYGGLKTIAELESAGAWTPENVPFNVDLARGLSEALKHYEQFVSELEVYFPDSALLIPRNASEHIHEPTAKDVLFENFFSINHPTRAIFLRTNNAGIGGAVAGGLTEPARPQREWESLYPQIASARQLLEDHVTGQLVLGTAGSVRIGATYSASDRFGDEVGNESQVWRWGSAPATGVASEWRDTPGVDAEEGAAVVIPQDLPAGNAGVFYGLLRLMITPYAQSDASNIAAATQAIQLSFLSSLKPGRNVETAAAGYRVALEILDQALGASSSPKDFADRLVSAIKSNNALKPYLIAGFRVQMLEKLYASILKTYAESANYWTGVTDANPDGRETQDLYYRAPITIGRAAIRDYVTRANPQIAYGIPASHVNPKAPMSQREVLAARAIVERASDPNASTDYSNVGSIFEPQSRGAAKLDIDNLPFVRNISSITDRSDERIQEQSRLRAIELAYQNRGASAYEVAQLDSYGDRLSKKRTWDWSQDTNAVPESEDEQARLFEAAYSTLSKPAELFGGEEISPAFRENYRLAVARLTGVTLLVALVFMFTSIVKNSLDCIIRYNILFPWNFILARPHATYTTLTTIKCRPGEGLGNSYIAKIETEASDDTSVHLHTLNVNYWAGVILTGYEQLFTVNNSFVSGYHGGLGVEFINPLTYNHGLDTNRRKAPSIMCFTSPRHEKLDDEHISITGAPSWYTREGEAINLNGIDNRFGYSSAAFYSGHYGFFDVAYNAQSALPGGASRYSSRVRAPNAICFASTAIYKSYRDHKPAYRTVQRGHWPNESVGPGAHAARIGQKSFDTTPTVFASGLQTIGVC